MANRTERRDSGIREPDEPDLVTITKKYQVIGAGVTTAILAAEPIFPVAGDYFGEDILDGAQATPEAIQKTIQLRNFIVEPLDGNISDTLVTVVYASGIDIRQDSGSGLRPTVWQKSTSLQQRTIMFDLSTPPKPIPGGAITQDSIVTLTATLDGTISNFNMETFAGTTNRTVFRGWGLEELLYLGSTEELKTGSDTVNMDGNERGVSVIRMTFMGNRRGWDHREPITSGPPDNIPTGFDEFFIRYEATEFRMLWQGTSFDPMAGPIA